ncbi:hypothetical protein GIB67_038143 [Kingdonia uniflora]|uniref:Uncharacterized protein n=1 Tax=Kingdonia uniflora TaxID=39325 RepID=A0A7J7M1X9_9MAGN|nr:hypothetical protein GIB67_038143 [Kingdonia uniflora]
MVTMIPLKTSGSVHQDLAYERFDLPAKGRGSFRALEVQIAHALPSLEPPSLLLSLFLRENVNIVKCLITCNFLEQT